MCLRLKQGAFFGLNVDTVGKIIVVAWERLGRGVGHGIEFPNGASLILAASLASGLAQV